MTLKVCQRGIQPTTTQVCLVLAKLQLRRRILPRKLRKKKARMKCFLVKMVPTLSTIYLLRHNPTPPICQVMLLENGLSGITAFSPLPHHHQSSPRRINPLTITITSRDFQRQVEAPIAQSMIGLVPEKVNWESATKTFNSRFNKKIEIWRTIGHSIRHQAPERLIQITTARIAAIIGKSKFLTISVDLTFVHCSIIRNSYDPYYSSMAPPVRNDVYYQQRSLDPPPGFGNDMSNSLRRRHVSPIVESWDIYTPDEQRRQREEEVNKKVSRFSEVSRFKKHGDSV